MKLVIQRVARASVTVDGALISSIDRGFLVLVGVRNGDTEADARVLADKCAGLRVFEDDAGKISPSAPTARTAAVRASPTPRVRKPRFPCSSSSYPMWRRTVLRSPPAFSAPI